MDDEKDIMWEFKRGIYQNEPNTIIVKEVTREEIEKTIKNLVKDGFFDNLGYR